MGGNLWTLMRVLRERRAQERSCGWTRAQLEKHQAQRVAALRQYALAHSPFTRRKRNSSCSRVSAILARIGCGLAMCISRPLDPGMKQSPLRTAPWFWSVANTQRPPPCWLCFEQVLDGQTIGRVTDGWRYPLASDHHINQVQVALEVCR
jgi:hypothetical protein